MIEKDSGYCASPCYDISIVVMVLTCNMALISVMMLTNAMVSISAMVLTHVMVLPVLWCYPV